MTYITSSWAEIVRKETSTSSKVIWIVKARLLNQDKVKNQSRFEIQLGSQSTYGNARASSAKISGDLTANLGYINIPTEYKVWTSGSFTINHDSLGNAAKTVDVIVSTTYAPLNASMRGNITFPTIPRENVINASGTEINGTNKCSIKISKKHSSFSSTVWVEFGSIKKTLGTKSANTDFSFSIPKEWAKEFPNVQSKRAYVYCETYSGDTKIGSKTSDYMTLSVGQEFAPKLTNALVKELNQAVLAKGENITLVGKSKKQLSAIVEAQLYSRIKEVYVISDSVRCSTLHNTTGNQYMDYTTTNRSGNFGFVAVDSRGLTTRVLVETQAYYYTAPSLKELIFRRNTPTGDSGYIKSNGEYFNQLSNILKVEPLIFKGSEQVTIPMDAKKLETNGIDWTFNKQISHGLNYDEAFSLKLKISDDFTTLIRRIDLPPSMPTLLVGKKTVQVNDYLIVEKDGSVGGKRILTANTLVEKTLKYSVTEAIKPSNEIYMTCEVDVPSGYKLISGMHAYYNNHGSIICQIRWHEGNKISVSLHNTHPSWTCPADNNLILTVLLARI
ncbi:DUF859 family phage minor structural protein [Bulleidia sp. zg-1006]|uniref:DUF859 family phage minor structural protein n=1 Tax=Bulleidia sp. zg-1006 TaxID=2806552 RepID=UPI001939CEA0|nr:DUF859 family phage minor structural protein [Bulleidia sp. zg-1006]QRG86367.1 hypothetical protein JOS54_05800 [Bulleidia sp. zg-1006]